MNAECFALHDADSQRVIDCLLSAETIHAYHLQTESEFAQIVEPSLMRHLRIMQQTAQQIMSGGVELVIAQERSSVDLLLTELFALATWHGWPLPVKAQGEKVLPPSLPRSGLLGTDARGDGAVLWLDQGVIYLSRSRMVSDQADMTHHWSGHDH